MTTRSQQYGAPNLASPKLLVIALAGTLVGCGDLHPAYPYFQFLCKREAGERIHRTAEGVRSIYQMKQPDKFQKAGPALYDSYGMRTNAFPTWSFWYDSWINNYPANFSIGKVSAPNAAEYAAAPYTQYEFFEAHAQDPITSDRFIRIVSEHVLTKPCSTYLCYNESEHRSENVGIEKPTSKYGYTWEVVHPRMFQHRIIGMEVKVIDLSTSEVMATARDYIYLPDAVRGKSAGFPRCEKAGGFYELISTQHFVQRVLKPPSYAPRRKAYESQP